MIGRRYAHRTYSYMCSTPSCSDCICRRPRESGPAWWLRQQQPPDGATRIGVQTERPSAPCLKAGITGGLTWTLAHNRYDQNYQDLSLEVFDWNRKL